VQPVEFKNLTPFDALAFSSLDTQDREYHVVVVKVGYQLVHEEGTRWAAQLMESAPVALCLADEHWGDPVLSSIRRESDLAPYKPRCDVLVQGSTYAPLGQPAAEWTAHLRLVLTRHEDVPEPVRPTPLNPLIGLTPQQLTQWEQDKRKFQSLNKVARARAPRTVLDKVLRIVGPSDFVRSPVVGWTRASARPVDQVSLRWESSFGGSCRVDAPRDAKHPEGPSPAPLLNEVCFSNPLGKGWLDARWEAALKQAHAPAPQRLPAPQIMGWNEPVLQAPVQAEHPTGEQDAQKMRAVAARYRVHPVGLSALGRAWAPRLALAGTYDATWLKERHPYLPKDFDFAYYNSAPEDQQIPFPDLTEGYELQTQGLMPGGGFMRVGLPPHRAVVLADLGGARLPLPMQMDTLELDTDSMQLSMVWRTACLKSMAPTTMELRFKLDPEDPWVRYHPMPEASDQPGTGASIATHQRGTA